MSTESLIGHLRQVNARQDVAQKMGLLPAIHALQDWQCRRLLVSHDALARQAKYQAAMAFFVEELYGPKDFSQRDAELIRVIPKLAKVLPDKALSALDDALALNALSYDLDMDMALALRSETISALTYAKAYRETGTQEKRQQQLDIIAHLGDQLADVVHIRGIGMLIKFARQPAKLAGVLALHEFLEQGFNAFKKLGNVQEFVEPVLTKERAIMLQLFDTNIDLTINNPIPEVK